MMLHRSHLLPGGVLSTSNVEWSYVVLVNSSFRKPNNNELLLLKTNISALKITHCNCQNFKTLKNFH
ncbi:Hypothetical predicted protein [Octopus vulgaris]|uniref:Uncharacterized protein n=1 Tax=Octopus vulgaris TaxID=6645 RepID=A0AA36B6Z8_OCTVU|nr:Hypothetical predicted protein [Octopus vulgaris]